MSCCFAQKPLTYNKGGVPSRPLIPTNSKTYLLRATDRFITPFYKRLLIRLIMPQSDDPGSSETHDQSQTLPAGSSIFRGTTTLEDDKKIEVDWMFRRVPATDLLSLNGGVRADPIPARGRNLAVDLVKATYASARESWLASQPAGTQAIWGADAFLRSTWARLTSGNQESANGVHWVFTPKPPLKRAEATSDPEDVSNPNPQGSPQSDLSRRETVPP